MNQQITALAKAVRQACAPRRRRPLLAGALVASASMLGSGAAVAGPEGGQVVGGVGTITQTGTNTLIQQGSDRLAIDWQSFNVATNESVRFDQPSSASVALNKIFDQNASQILGALDANGQVYLINPNGIIFGQNATINVGALIASSLNVSLEDFMAGHPEFKAEGNAGLVVNRGLIKAATGGSVALLGGSVANEGVIVADLGQVTLGAGTHAALDFDGDGLLFFTIDGEGLTNAQGEAAVSNSGTIQANGGTVLLSGKAAQNVFSNVVNNEGVIRANRIENVGGVVRLVGDGAPVITSGTIDVSGGDAASTGGRIELLGEKVGVAGGASLLADGAAGGGTILVGGDLQGGGGVRTADYTFVGKDAQLSANATVDGDGGKVIVWADEVARVYGDISANGGAEGGDGGFIETSGKKLLDFQGSVSAGAPNGLGGTWLLDPENVVIDDDTQTNIDQTGDENSDEEDPPVNFQPAAADEPATVIDVANINAALDAGLNVTINTQSAGGAEGNITVAAPIVKSVDGGNQDGSSLTLEADNDIIVNQSITAADGPLNVTLVADRNVDVNAEINTGGGAIDISVDANDNGGDQLRIGDTLTASGGITLRGSAGLGDTLLVDLAGGETAMWNVTSANGGTLTAGASTPGATFVNFSVLTGGAQTDAFIFTGTGDVAAVSGAGNNDVFNFGASTTVTADIAGGAGDDRFEFAGGEVTGTVAGEAGDDTFAVAAGGVDVPIQAILDGGADSDTVDLAAFSAAQAQTIMLTASGAAGFNGSVTGVADFTGIDQIIGGSGTDTITGAHVAATWSLGGTNTYNAGGNTLAFSSLELLVGGVADDTFDIDAPFGGTVDGGGAATVDVLDLSGLATPLAANLDTGAADGFTGTVTGITDFERIGNLIGGGSGADTLNGLAAAATWTLAGAANTYASGGNTLAFSGFETVAGSGAFVDTFNVTGAFAGTVDGNAGADILDLSALAAPRNVVLTGSVATGFAGDVVSHGVSFLDIDDLRAGAGTDSLTGSNADATWGLAASTTYTVGSNTLLFSEFETLIGGGLVDTFDVDAAFADSIDGAAGADILDLAGLTAPRDVVLTAGSATGFSGTVAAIGGGFTNIDDVRGGTTGTDSLTGLAADATWSLDATPTYTAGGNPLAFSAFETLIGGSGVDTFDVDAAFTGSIDGAGGADILDLAGLTAPRSVTLTAGTATGFSGTATGLSGGFTNIDDMRGGTTGTDSLTGLAADATWSLDATPTYTSGGNTLAFSAFEALIGGSDVDTFEVDAAFTGSVDGAGAADILDLSGLTAPRSVTLTAGSATGFAGTATGVSGGFTNIDDVRGGTTGTDSLTGLAAVATWSLDGTPTYTSGSNTLAFSEFETLVGGSGADTFDLDDVFAGSVAGNGGTDVLDLGGFATARNVSLSVAGVTGFSGAEAAVAGGFSGIDVLVGGTGNDTLTGVNAAATWTIDGGATEAYTHFSGSMLTFSGIENLTGGSLADTFNFSTPFAGNVSGAGGDDVFNVLAGTSLSGTVAGNAGNDSFNFFAGGDLTGTGTGDDGDDAFALGDAGATVTGTLLAGNTGETTGDRLVGSPDADTFTVTGAAVVLTNASGGSLDVDDIEVLAGGAGDDTFVLNNAFAGSVDGDVGADILNLSAIPGDRTVTLTSVGPDGFSGTEPVLTGGFADINDIRAGAGGNDSLTGLNAPATWNLSGGGNTYAAGGGTLAFSGFDNTTGGSAADVFNLLAGGTLGVIVAGDGDDEVDFNGGNVTTSVNTGSGNDTFRLTNPNVAVAATLDAGTGGESGGGDTVVSPAGNPAISSTFTVASAGTVALTISGSAGAMTVANVESLTGGAGNDTFAFTGAGNITGTATGGAGADLFDVDTAIAGTIVGGAGGDFLDLVGLAGARNVQLTAGGAQGFAGTEAAVGGGFSEIDSVFAAAGTGSTVTGLNATSTWTVGSYASGGNTLVIGGFANLVGGSGADMFDIDAAFDGSVDGNGGSDTLDLATFATARNVTLTAGTANGFAGTEASLTGGFADIESIVGGAGTDSLTGLNAAATFGIDGTNTYASGGNTLAFSAFEDLIGGTDADTFDVDLAHTGSIDGNGGADVLDLGGVAGARSVTLTASTATGFAGTDAALTGGFADIDDLRVGAGAGDSLAGLNAAAVWALGGSNTYASGGNTLAFAGFDSLTGGTAADTFDVDAAFAGSVNGNGGADILDIAGVAGARDVVLTASGIDGFTGTDNSVAGGFSGIDEILACAACATDSLTGLDATATWQLDGTNTYTSGGNALAFTSFETLVGGTGADTFDVDLAHVGTVAGNAGADVLDLSTIATARNVVLTAAGASGFDGTEGAVSGGFSGIDDIRGGSGAADSLTGLQNVANVWNIGVTNSYVTGGNTLAFAGIENLLGGTQADTFNFASSFSGNVQGSQGNNVFNFNAGVFSGTATATTGDDTFNFAGGDVTGTVLAGDGDDRFNLVDPNVAVTATLEAGGGDDSVVGTADGNTFAVATAGGVVVSVNGAAAGELKVNDVENLVGGAGDDTFAFSGTGDITGTVTGAGGNDTFDLDVGIAGTIVGGAGTDVLDIVNVVGGRDAALTAGAADGFSGTEAAVGGGFSGIDDLRAGAATTDALTGLDAAATFGLDGTNTYTTGGNTLAFAGFETLNGGSQADTFDVDAASIGGTLNGNGGDDRFNVNASAAAAMNGGAGSDTFALANGVTAGGILDGGTGAGDVLDLSAFAAARDVQITAADADGFDGTEGSVAQGFRNMNEVRGSTAAAGDRLRGIAATGGTFTLADAGNTYVVGGQTLRFVSFNSLVGSSAADTFNLAGTLPGAVDIAGGGGADSATVTGGLTVGSLSIADVETVTSAGAGGVVNATGALTITGATGGIGTQNQALMTNVASLSVSGAGTRVNVSEANALTVTGVSTTNAPVEIRLLGAGDMVIGVINAGPAATSSGSVTLNVASGSIGTAPGSQAVVSGSSATLIATGNIGTTGEPITLDIAETGLITLQSSTAAIHNIHLSPVVDNVTGGIFDAISQAIGSAAGTSTQSAVQDTSAIDWAGLDPNVALVDCLQPCVRLPADQSEEEEGLAKVREASKLLLIRTSDGWKMIPVFPLETTAAVR